MISGSHFIQENDNVQPVGSSRIPTFGSRLPQPSSSAVTAIPTSRIAVPGTAVASGAISRSPTQPTAPPIRRTVRNVASSRPRSPQPLSRQGSAASLKGSSSKPSSRPTSRPPSRPVSPSAQAVRPGQTAQVGGKRGIVRYVGPVHWAAGLWCGLEVAVGLGKNDGAVHGRRYFQCPPTAGVMAPLAKVQVLHVDPEQSQREGNDDVSGPHSMLFIESQVERKNINTTSSTFIVSRDTPDRRPQSEVVCNRPEILNKKRCNDTFVTSCSGIPQVDQEDKQFQNCENSLSDSNIEVKRRRTSNTKNKLIESLTLRSLPESIEKPTSLPPPKSSCSTPPLASLVFKKLSYTSVKNEIAEPLLRKLRNSFIGSSDKNHEEDSKTDSLDDSLGILTPDQMSDFPSFAQTRLPSFEYENGECSMKKQDEADCEEKPPCPKTLSLALPQSNFSRSKEDLQSPNAGTADYSFGIIDDQVLSNLTLITDTTVNLDDLNLARMEQTPSPEELPLDPTPIVEADKVDATKVKTTNNFVTSITSITSLDTGYQGDGEMSRPASRGADSSPLTRRPLPRPQVRRQDPMTDSDFYTESDADNHDDNQLKGDRKAQVIDGTLYGVDPQAAADIYVNNRENMDSSGIFTDIENPSRTEEDIVDNAVPDPSPSDTASTKTISAINSQNNLQDILDKKNESKDIIEKQVPKENPKKRNASSPRLYTASPVRSKEESIAKKYKMPKREVTSKVKSMIKSPQVQTPEAEKKKPVGRWDAVMSRITKTDSNKTNLKEVKSKVYNNVRPTVMQKSPNNKFNTTPPPAVKRPRSALSSASPIERRVRNRSSTGSVSKIGNLENSINSSLSDLSAATLPPNSKTIGELFNLFVFARSDVHVGGGEINNRDARGPGA
ncbi:unnamed protein product [Acanthoscelides obtectus]|uniref:CAP-Gly domain-containing protein n=1 Tax=Acanthoscelides obtectus TaxID=200917 RepID=A0A9P0LSC7_ACAOB|nr:unnamed protein product [Acanthoscelides obtectus]CAK1675158.1 CAP-Gly domain-containing linker protein 1 [Acanthoscelides obtectus]